MSAQGLPTSLEHMRRNQSIATMIASGVDMFLLESMESMLDHVKNLRQLVDNDIIPMERLDDVVAKVLAVKLAFNLIEVLDCSKS